MSWFVRIILCHAMSGQMKSNQLSLMSLQVRSCHFINFKPDLVWSSHLVSYSCLAMFHHVMLCCPVLSYIVGSRYIAPYSKKKFTWLIETKCAMWLAIVWKWGILHHNRKVRKSASSVNTQTCLGQYLHARFLRFVYVNIYMLGKHSDLFTSISTCSVNTQICLPDVSYGIHYATSDIVL